MSVRVTQVAPADAGVCSLVVRTSSSGSGVKRYNAYVRSRLLSDLTPDPLPVRSSVSQLGACRPRPSLVFAKLHQGATSRHSTPARRVHALSSAGGAARGRGVISLRRPRRIALAPLTPPGALAAPDRGAHQGGRAGGGGSGSPPLPHAIPCVSGGRPVALRAGHWGLAAQAHLPRARRHARRRRLLAQGPRSALVPAGLEAAIAKFRHGVDSGVARCGEQRRARRSACRCAPGGMRFAGTLESRRTRPIAHRARACARRNALFCALRHGQRRACGGGSAAASSDRRPRVDAGDGWRRAQVPADVRAPPGCLVAAV